MKKTKLLSELKLTLEQGLKENGHTKTSKIRITCDGDIVTIQGKVKSYYQKQMVLSVVKKLGGFMEIKDDVIVD
jgi:osmotically-inducible protein OsmY